MAPTTPINSLAAVSTDFHCPRRGSETVEVLPGRLYWLDIDMSPDWPELPKNTLQKHHFCIDNEFIYEPFNRDFGPLHLGMVYRYCKLLEDKLAEHAATGTHVVHCCSQDPQTRANAALLICAYRVIVLSTPAEEAWAPFKNIKPLFMPYRDATSSLVSHFDCHIIDCLEGLEHAIKNEWFDRSKFNVLNYEFFSRVDKGDMNWIVPQKFLAFCGPSPTKIDSDGYPAFTPEDYGTIFKKVNIGLVVRLNNKQYDRKRFTDLGVKHLDLFFKDGSCPTPEIIAKFLEVAEQEPGAVAIHCKAGLGRTGTLIALYAMKHFQFPARAFIGWNRLCRPGSILGPQQQFLCHMEKTMFQAGVAMRCPEIIPAGLKTDADCLRLAVPDNKKAEEFEDVGQAERLLNAKKGNYLHSGVSSFLTGIKNGEF